jgi:hypothetical protein
MERPDHASQEVMHMRFALIIILILLVSCTEKPIGGERDEHNCLGAAGYSWNEEVGACVREWELDDKQRDAAKLAVAGLEGYTVTRVEEARCPGCYKVHIEKEGQQTMVQIHDGKVAEAPQAEKEPTHMSLEEAMEIAEQSDCAKEGGFTDEAQYNDFTKTWWIEMDIDREGCLPACVVLEEARTAEISWRCTGALPPNANPEMCNTEGGKMTLGEAMVIASQSECTEEGALLDTHQCNVDTATWWIDIDAERPGCRPACAIDIETRTAEINWRCTGVIP